MCGIAGIAFTEINRRAEPVLLRRMTQAIRHRGPDSDGFHIAPGIGLGMRRLSIIDPENGDQPITNEDGSVIVICNGEIYNHLELRKHLTAAGHTFSTNSDTEVIAHLYEDEPETFLDRLRGMFAIALWDATRRRLTLARDRFGIKPLHYAVTTDGLVFGSELKAVLASGLVAPTLDRSALHEVFNLGYVRSPRSMVTGVQRLRPAQCLMFQAGHTTTRTYWDLTFPDAREYDRKRTAGEWAEALRAKLTESVRLHLRSDVPVGAWLSAGIDSSAVVALMHAELRRSVPTFTLGFENPQVDELRRCRILDEFPEFELDGHRTECRSSHFSLLPQAIWHREQPFSLGVEISRWLIAEMSARHVKVVLCGEGADEALGGYAWYRADKALAVVRHWPLSVRRLAAAAVRGRWPGAATIMLAPAEMGVSRFRALSGGSTNAAIAADLLVGGTNPETDEQDVPEGFKSWHRFAQLQYLDFKLRMAESIVQHLDAISMAHSVEARVPFLDHPLVEFCSTIPPWIALHRWQEKAVLRDAMRGLLPPEICKRKKVPMSAPVQDWMRRPLPELAMESLSGSRVRAAGYFEPACVARLLSQHQSGAADHSRLLLLITGTHVWDDLFSKSFL